MAELGLALEVPEATNQTCCASAVCATGGAAAEASKPVRRELRPAPLPELLVERAMPGARQLHAALERAGGVPPDIQSEPGAESGVEGHNAGVSKAQERSAGGGQETHLQRVLLERWRRHCHSPHCASTGELPDRHCAHGVQGQQGLAAGGETQLHGAGCQRGGGQQLPARLRVHHKELVPNTPRITGPQRQHFCVHACAVHVAIHDHLPP
mmetsp:Transcript_117781/g.380085  ORF Transcript_117781/g.380085 Transcript_117781/m.380085 type:complete len:211 (+) Transcript_117781:291-923(+)